MGGTLFSIPNEANINYYNERKVNEIQNLRAFLVNYNCTFKKNKRFDLKRIKKTLTLKIF